MIEAINIKKEFLFPKPTEVLKGISLEIKGGLNIISGRSGSGKTTLMNVLSGLDSVTSGRVVINETDITHLSKSSLDRFRRKNIGFVFQSVALHSQFNAYENVALMQKLVGQAEDRNLILNLFEEFGLIGKENRSITELSGGEQQRIAIIRAIINKPKIIFADEPTAQLDFASAQNVAQIFNKLSKEITIVMTTHDNEILSFADKIFKIEDGILV